MWIGDNEIDPILITYTPRTKHFPLTGSNIPTAVRVTEIILEKNFSLLGEIGLDLRLRLDWEPTRNQI